MDELEHGPAGQEGGFQKIVEHPDDAAAEVAAVTPPCAAPCVLRVAGCGFGERLGGIAMVGRAAPARHCAAATRQTAAAAYNCSRVLSIPVICHGP